MKFRNMKIELHIYQEKFNITDKEIEEYFEWYYIPEPSKTDINKYIKGMIEKLKKQVEWTRKIGNKYSEGFMTCKEYNINASLKEITILK